MESLYVCSQQSNYRQATVAEDEKAVTALLRVLKSEEGRIFATVNEIETLESKIQDFE